MADKETVEAQALRVGDGGDWMYYPGLNRVRIGPQWFEPVVEPDASREEVAYDKGYDDGWEARDQAAGNSERRAYDNGWLDGVKATLERKPYLPLDAG